MDKINTDISEVPFLERFKTDENNFRWVMLEHINPILKRLHEERSDLKENLKELRECVAMSEIFFDDVMPQLGGICIQDFYNVNQLAIALTKLSGEKL